MNKINMSKTKAKRKKNEYFDEICTDNGLFNSPIMLGGNKQFFLKKITPENNKVKYFVSG